MEYYYILTVQLPTGNSWTMLTNKGVLTPKPNATRAGILQDLLVQLEKNAGLNPEHRTSASRPVPILFFSLEPNRL